jgi:RNA polymerase sigma factor (TIGR02999 family)
MLENKGVFPIEEATMNDSRKGEVTGLLVAWKNGSPEALDELIPIVYSELRRLASRELRGERRDHSLQPTALTHEAFIRLFGARRISWQNRAHFFAVASQLMRRVLVEHARNRRAAKRGGAPTRVVLNEATQPAEAADVDVIALHDALNELEKVDSRQSRIVELKYFGGLKNEETAEVLSISPATVKRDWSVAKLWLRRALEGADPP